MKNPFFNTIVGFVPYWDYKPTNAIHADSPGAYTSEKCLNLSTIDKIHLKCDATDGSVIKRIREPILFSFILCKPDGFKVICEPETIHYKKLNKSDSKTITFYLEEDDHKEVNFNGNFNFYLTIN